MFPLTESDHSLILVLLTTQLHNAEDDEDIKVLFAMDEALDLLMTTGFRKPVANLTISDRQNLSAALLDYHLMAKVKAEMDQFCEGLSTLEFLKAVRATPSIFTPYFTQIKTNLTPGTYTRRTCTLDYVSLHSMHSTGIVHFFRVYQGACRGEFLPERQLASPSGRTGLYLFHRLSG